MEFMGQNTREVSYAKKNLQNSVYSPLMTIFSQMLRCACANDDTPRRMTKNKQMKKRTRKSAIWDAVS